MKNWMDKMKKYRVTLILLVITIVMGIVAVDTRKNREDLVYAESLDLVVAVVEDKELTLKDFAVYVAHQEAQVQELAILYDPENTRAYWNVHTDGTYISHAARNEAMSMAIHDELFYQLSQDLEITFSDEERKLLQNDVDDFWNDLVDEEKEKRLGITKEDVYDTMLKIACAEKCQMIYAKMHGLDYNDFDFYEEEFLKFLEEYEYEVYDSVLSRIDFGDVTLVHERDYAYGN